MIHIAGRARVEGVRRGAVVAVGLALVVACTGFAGPGSGRTPGAPSAPASPGISAARPAGGSALGSNGELAFVAHGRLFLLGGPAGPLRRVGLPGVPEAPAWSADHRWLAVEVQPPAAGSQSQPTALWLVNAAGTRARRLSRPSWDITGFAWSPRARRIAVAADLSGTKTGRSLVATLGLTGRRKILAAGSRLTGPEWSPSGRQIAFTVNTINRRDYWRGTLELQNTAGGHPRVIQVSKGSTIELAAWWPDSSGLLYWLDPLSSASIADDGLPLFSVPLATLRSRELVTSMLLHGSWLAFSPDGHTVAAVSGDGREIWRGGKHVVICRSSGNCTPVAGPASVVALQSSWSPDGRTLVFTRASARGPFGPGGRATFSPYWTRRWQSTSRLYLAAADGTGVHRLSAAGRGALDPVWGSDGSLLFVRDDSLWLLPAGASAPRRLTRPLGAIPSAFYGYVAYPESIAWTRARPLSTAG
jgi:Tol biopolymer transport system component